MGYPTVSLSFSVPVTYWIAIGYVSDTCFKKKEKSPANFSFFKFSFVFFSNKFGAIINIEQKFFKNDFNIEIKSCSKVPNIGIPRCDSKSDAVSRMWSVSI